MTCSIQDSRIRQSQALILPGTSVAWKCFLENPGGHGVEHHELLRRTAAWMLWECTGLFFFRANSHRSLGSVSPTIAGDCPLTDASRDGTKPLHLLWFWSALVQHMSQIPSTVQDHLLPADLGLGSFSLPTTWQFLPVAVLAGGNAVWLSVTCSL